MYVMCADEMHSNVFVESADDQPSPRKELLLVTDDHITTPHTQQCACPGGPCITTGYWIHNTTRRKSCLMYVCFGVVAVQ